LGIQRSHFQAQLGLVKSISHQKRYDEALELLKPILRESPDNLEALLCQAICYQGVEKIGEAKEIYQQIIKYDRLYIPAYIGLAELKETQGDYLEAIRLLQQVKEEIPDPLDVLGDLARIYRDYGMHAQSIESCNEALIIDPDNQAARFYMALALGDSAHFEEAMTELEELDKETPDDPKIIVAKASQLEKLGEYDQAHNLITRYFDSGHVPASFVDIYARLCHRYDECDNAIALMDRSLAKLGFDKEYRRGLLFTLAKLHDRLGNYEEAFFRIDEANRLKSYHYDHDEYVKYIDRLISPKVTDLLKDITS